MTNHGATGCFYYLVPVFLESVNVNFSHFYVIGEKKTDAHIKEFLLSVYFNE